ncbi:MAG: hypothetical protein ABEI13_00485, partial [Candidatus Paceibacteria bacterium]
MVTNNKYDVYDLFWPASLVSILALLIIVDRYLGTILAIKGSYVLIGLLISAIVYFLPRVTEYSGPDWTSKPESLISKLIFILISLSIITQVVLDTRIPLLLVFFPIGFGLIGIQLYYTPSSPLRLAETIGLFSTSIMTKYSEYYRLIGNGDMILHIEDVVSVILSGSIEPIGRGYSNFPVLHLLSGITSIISNLHAYDSLVMIGVFTSIFLILVFFAISRMISSVSVAIYVAFSATMLKPIHFYTTFVYPQSLAVIFAMYVLYVSYRGEIVGRRGTFVVIGTIFSCSLILTHHFTIILMLPIVLMLTILPHLLSSIDNGIYDGYIERPSPVLLWLSVIMALSYWTFREVFFGGLYFSIMKKIQQDILINSSSDSVGIISVGYIL